MDSYLAKHGVTLLTDQWEKTPMIITVRLWLEADAGFQTSIPNRGPMTNAALQSAPTRRSSQHWAFQSTPRRSGPLTQVPSASCRGPGPVHSEEIEESPVEH